MSVKKDFKIWEGVFDEWPEESAETTFSNKELMDAVIDRLEISLKALKQGKPDLRTSIYNQYPIPLMIALLHQKKIKVLDFGGGLGLTYLATKAALTALEELEYIILEFPELVAYGEKRFASEKNLKFISRFEDCPEIFDIVFCGSSFQYVKEWKDMIKKFVSFQPKYIVFGDLLAGEIPAFISLQNNRGNKVPVRFYNFAEVCDVLAEHSYDLLFDCFHEQLILGKRAPLPLDNFDEKNRISYGRNLIFHKST